MTRLPGHVSGPGEMRHAHEISVVNLKKKSPWRPECKREDNITRQIMYKITLRRICLTLKSLN